MPRPKSGRQENLERERAQRRARPSLGYRKKERPALRSEQGASSLPHKRPRPYRRCAALVRQRNCGRLSAPAATVSGIAALHSAVISRPWQAGILAIISNRADAQELRLRHRRLRKLARQVGG